MTKYHAKYLASALRLRHASNDIANLSRSIANARVDLNPHQVRAALFALQSPLSKGVILADEVGLGKTIEAGLVIAQRWAERKRHILLIVPAFLRKQWEQELREKFFLPVAILDSKKFKDAKLAGNPNPFDNEKQLIVCSYAFAAAQQEYLNQVQWDLVVIDEAHRLRNVYKNSSKQAKVIGEALEGRPKLLLTATPLQNNLMELYGLVSIIDPLIFGDPESFKIQFLGSGDEEGCFHRLRERLRPVAIRTLRKQVQGYVSFTSRRAFTQPFCPTDDEQKLYDGVSAYLQKDELLALPTSQRQLITIILRKLLASSPTAISHTLQTLVKRLQKECGPEVLLDPEESEILGTLSEDWAEGSHIEAAVVDPAIVAKKEQIRQEIAELQSYIDLAASIKQNTKSEALLLALQTAFAEAQRLGAPEKVVVFTESKRTQTFLFEFLSSHGYANQLVVINGSNSDSHSRIIYETWLKDNSDTGRITGSKAVDIKAALVDFFRTHAKILLATEAVSEGVNLQFCSLIINYDLPWNPQRVEQRIGRCHRYGQKHDVVVINFINQRNEADQRVYELLRDKFKLFDGVFGASDEILGAIESGVDIEKRIAELYQTCRTSEQIQEAFQQLRRELDADIQETIRQTKATIFEHLDEEVIALLKIQESNTRESLNRREELLLAFLQRELKGTVASSEEIRTIEFKDSVGVPQRYYFDWQRAEINQGRHLREDDPLVQEALEVAAMRDLELAEIAFDYASHPNKISALEPYRGCSGWLELSRYELKSFEPVEFLIFCAKTDAGEVLHPEVCEKLFLLSGVSSKASGQACCFDFLREGVQAEYRSQVEQRDGVLYDQEVQKLDAWSEDLKIGLEKELKEIEKEIREMRKLSRQAKTLAEKLESQRKIKTLETQRSAKRRTLYSEQDLIEERRESLIAGLEARIVPQVSSTPLFTIRWTLK